MKIKPEQVMPLILIAIDVIAAIVYLWQGQPKKSIYWIAAAVLNWAVTF